MCNLVRFWKIWSHILSQLNRFNTLDLKKQWTNNDHVDNIIHKCTQMTVVCRMINNAKLPCTKSAEYHVEYRHWQF